MRDIDEIKRLRDKDAVDCSPLPLRLPVAAEIRGALKGLAAIPLIVLAIAAALPMLVLYVAVWAVLKIGLGAYDIVADLESVAKP